MGLDIQASEKTLLITINEYPEGIVGYQDWVKKRSDLQEFTSQTKEFEFYLEHYGKNKLLPPNLTVKVHRYLASYS